MALTYDTNEYQIPRGRVFFDPFAADGVTLTGERYIGNCPGVTLAIATQKAEHYSSEAGLRQKDKSVLVQVDRTGKLDCDNMSLDNMALFFSGEVEAIAQTSTSVTNEAVSALADRYYQLGYGTSTPGGARNVSAVVVEADAAIWAVATAYAVGAIRKPTTGADLHYYRCTVAGTSHAATEPTWPTDGSTVTDGTVTWEDGGPLLLVAGTDYNTDLTLGRLQILATGRVGTHNSTGLATPLVVDYTRPAAAWERLKTGAATELTGALRVVSDNASGANRDFYMPSVSLTPDGDLPLIAENTDFAKVGFALEVLKPTNMEAIYVDGRPA